MVVIIVIWVIMLLVVYMGFLICLDPLINKRAKASYQEHTNEEVGTELLLASYWPFLICFKAILFLAHVILFKPTRT